MATYYEANQSLSPEAWYRFGTTLTADETGDHAGTLVGEPTSTAGPATAAGFAMTSFAFNRFFIFPNVLLGAPSSTVAFFARVRNGGSMIQVMLNLGYATGLYYDNDQGRIYADLVTENQGNRFTEAPFSLNTWHHIAWVVDRDADQVRLYVDGTIATTKPLLTGVPRMVEQGRIGVFSNSGNYPADTTDVAEFNLFPRALNQEEISRLVHPDLYTPVGPVDPVQKPVNIMAPSITGNTIIGQDLTCTSGAWDSGPNAYSYQWTKEDSSGVKTDIAGKTMSSLYLSDQLRGYVVSCRVGATNSAGTTLAESQTVGPVIDQPVSSSTPVAILSLLRQRRWR